MERCGMGWSVSSCCFVNLPLHLCSSGITQSAAASSCTWSEACLEMWDLRQLVSPFCDTPAPLPPPLAPLCSHLSSCPVRSGPVRPSVWRVLLVCSRLHPSTSLPHCSGLTDLKPATHSAADPQEALLAGGSGGKRPPP